jgi:hypothetical protein
VDCDEPATCVLYGQNLHGHSPVIVAEEEQAIGLRRIVGWRLDEGESTMTDDETDLIIGDAMLPCCRGDVDPQPFPP